MANEQLGLYVVISMLIFGKLREISGLHVTFRC